MSKSNNKKEAYIGIVGVIIFISLILFIFKSWHDEKLDIEKNGIDGTGEIIRVYRIRNRGTFIVFRFGFNGKYYEEHQAVEDDYKIGDCYKVLFSSKNPEHAKLLLSEKRTCN